MRSSISSDRARSFTFRTVGAYYSNVMLAVWPRLALRSYGEGANMAKMAVPLPTTRVLICTLPYMVPVCSVARCTVHSAVVRVFCTQATACVFCVL